MWHRHAAISRRRNAGVLPEIFSAQNLQGLSRGKPRIAPSAARVSDRRLVARQFCRRKTRRHRREIQLGPGCREQETRTANHPGGRFDAGKRGRRRPQSAAFCSGRLERRGVVTGQEGSCEGAEVYRGGEDAERDSEKVTNNTTLTLTLPSDGATV